LTGNIVTNPGNFKKSIQMRQAAISFKTPPDCGRWFEEGLNLDVAKINKETGRNDPGRSCQGHGRGKILILLNI
jgi:hypothetical protein